MIAVKTNSSITTDNLPSILMALICPPEKPQNITHRDNLTDSNYFHSAGKGRHANVNQIKKELVGGKRIILSVNARIIT
jgi:hypothetical protein